MAKVADLDGIVQPAPGLLTFNPIIETQYNDTDPALHAELIAGHIPTAILAFTTPVQKPLWQDPGFDGGRRVCVRTLRDQTFPPAAQEMFMANCGVGWNVVEVDAGHRAFVAKPEEVGRCIVRAAESLYSTQRNCALVRMNRLDGREEVYYSS